MPSRQEIRVRNLFNVVDCKLHWQRNGDYLCVKVDRTPKGTQVHKSSKGGETDSFFFFLNKSQMLNFFFKILLRAWSQTLKSSAWERSRFLLTWWRWRVKTELAFKAMVTVTWRKIKAWSIVSFCLSRKHYSICMGAQRQQVCSPPRRVSSNQCLFLSCQK